MSELPDVAEERLNANDSDSPKKLERAQPRKQKSITPHRRFLWLGAVHFCWFGWNSVGPISAKYGRILLKFESLESLGQKLQQNPCALRLLDLAAFFIEQKRSKNAPYLTKGIVSG